MRRRAGVVVGAVAVVALVASGVPAAAQGDGAPRAAVTASVAPSKVRNVPLGSPTAAVLPSARAMATDDGTGRAVQDAPEPVAADDLAEVPLVATSEEGRVVSVPIDATGTQDVGLTWPATEDGTALGARVRTLADGTWSDWQDLEVADDAPDSGSADARHARGGTDLLWVGAVDAIQLSVAATPDAPGAELALVGPDATARSAAVAAAPTAAVTASSRPVTTVDVPMTTREQWGAAAPSCDPGTARDGLVGAAVHHTASRNTYSTVAEAQQDLRNIQAYHMASRGWCDIGYNFVVDKWGNLYEGRAGSLSKAVIGVHAGGFNTGTVGVSMLGDYTSVAPSAATLATVGMIIGVRLGVYGADPTGTMSYATGVGENSRFQNETVVLPRVFGHRDVAYTACPGNLAYPQLGAIRSIAARAAVGLGPCPDTTSGYWLVGADGGVFAFCAAGYAGSMASSRLAQPIVTAMGRPAGSGYWLVASDGGVFSFGDAAFYGSTGAIRLNKPIVTAMATPSGRGYWLVASDGGVFTFGDAAFYGSTGAIRLNKPIVTAMATPSGRGYWLIASDGGVFTFGDAAFYGSTGAMRLNQPIVTGFSTPSGRGYWLIASDGGVFTFGDATFYGSTGAIRLNRPITGGASTRTGAGYWLAASDGGIFAFGDAPFLGSVGNVPLGAPVVVMARA